MSQTDTTTRDAAIARAMAACTMATTPAMDIHAEAVEASEAALSACHTTPGTPAEAIEAAEAAMLHTTGGWGEATKPDMYEASRLWHMVQEATEAGADAAALPEGHPRQ